MNLTPDDDGEGMTLDEAATAAGLGLTGLDALDPAPRPAPVTLAAHIGAILNQADALTYGDVRACGPGLASALEDLAEALDGEHSGDVKGAALELIEITRNTEPHRQALDARPARPAFDGPHEMYPRGVLTVPPRYSHADRRSPMLGSIELMADYLGV